MFHFSADRLAGLDTMILKISAPPKVPTLIPNDHHDTYRIPVRKLRKQKPHRDTRTPLADKTASVCNSTTPSPRPFISPFRRLARFIRRVPCSYTLFPPRARQFYSPQMILLHQTYPRSVPSLPFPRLPACSCPPFSISLPSPLHRLQIRPLAVHPPRFLHPPSFASLLLQSLPHAVLLYAKQRCSRVPSGSRPFIILIVPMSLGHPLSDDVFFRRHRHSPHRPSVLLLRVSVPVLSRRNLGHHPHSRKPITSQEGRGFQAPGRASRIPSRRESKPSFPVSGHRGRL